MSNDWLEIRGIKQNNLKNLNLRIPHNQVVAVTGVSGSGKSSLAFDTVFAEGQWRFIESLSTYAKLFLEKLARPQLDEVKNIRPAIALEQRNPVKGMRSTVGTTTEIYDLLRVVYARVSDPYCPVCGDMINRWDTSQVISELVGNFSDARAIITFETDEPLPSLISRGFYRIYVDGEVKDADAVGVLKGPYNVVIDRVVIRDEPRVADSVELAWREGSGKMKVIILDKGTFTYSNQNTCQKCLVSLPDPIAIAFSYNHPVGACVRCKGFGSILQYDEALLVPDDGLSLHDGAIAPWEKPSFRWWKDQLIKYSSTQGIDIEKPFREITSEEKQILYNGGKGFYGINDFFEALEEKRYKLHVRVFLSRYRSADTCPECSGKRLKREMLSYKIASYDIGALSALSIGKLHDFFAQPPLSEYKLSIVAEALRHIQAKLEILMRVGLNYLTLDRQTATLSGGEFQRINLANQLSCRLAGALYVLDEPTVGLHSKDNEKISEIIRELSTQGNTILVVEHDPEIIGSADWIVELGPGGKDGGEIVFNGPINDFIHADTITSRYLVNPPHTRVFIPPHTFKHFLTVKGARGHNIKGIDVRIPLGSFTVVSGASGSGKSTLVVETLFRALSHHFRESADKPLDHDELSGIDHIKGATLIDQSPIGRNPRSNAATYVKLFDTVRKLFAAQPEAKVYGFSAGFFSFNLPGGRCEKCKGEGYQKVEMYFFEDLYVKCDECGGKRFTEEALKVRYKGYSINDVLNFTVEEALRVFSEETSIVKRLELLNQVGLGYLSIGQPANTLSGGEAQRIKICAELGVTPKKHHLYILDEPTIGLHMHDVSALIFVLRKLIEGGNTVIVIEHNLDIIASADWVIDLGPDGGDKGGTVVFQGSAEELLAHPSSYTAASLNKKIVE